MGFLGNFLEMRQKASLLFPRDFFLRKEKETAFAFNDECAHFAEGKIGKLEPTNPLRDQLLKLAPLTGLGDPRVLEN